MMFLKSCKKSWTCMKVIFDSFLSCTQRQSNNEVRVTNDVIRDPMGRTERKDKGEIGKPAEVRNRLGICPEYESGRGQIMPFATKRRDK